MMLPDGVKDWYPGTAISLGEMMRRFESQYLFRVSRALTAIELHLSGFDQQQENFDDEGVEVFLTIMSDLRGSLTPIGLDFTLLLVDRIEKTIQIAQMTPEVMRFKLTDISERIDDELESVLVLQVPKERASYFERTNGFGPEVANCFPDVAFDLEEAYNCMALARYNACVYHVMRATEVGIQRLGNDLGVPDAHKLTWGSITSQCRSKVKGLPKGSARTQREEAMNHLDGVRSVWRNPTMHPGKPPYTENQTRDILDNAKALMVSLAGFL